MKLFERQNQKLLKTFSFRKNFSKKKTKLKGMKRNAIEGSLKLEINLENQNN